MLIISDSNIFIDMEVGGLTHHMFKLPESIGTPNILFEEELAVRHPDLPDLGLLLLEVEAEYMVIADQWQVDYPGPTINDLFSMALALQEQCPLLTGDMQLRQAAVNENIEIHGTLWLMDRMHSEGIIKIKTVEKSYDLMRKANRRLPWDMVDNQIQEFRKNNQQSIGSDSIDMK